MEVAAKSGTDGSDAAGSANMMAMMLRWIGMPLVTLYENVFLLPMYFPDVTLLRGMYLLIVLRLLFMVTSWLIYVVVSGKRAKFAFDVIQMWVAILGLQCMFLQTYPTWSPVPPKPASRSR